MSFNPDLTEGLALESIGDVVTDLDWRLEGDCRLAEMLKEQKALAREFAEAWESTELQFLKVPRVDIDHVSLGGITKSVSLREAALNSLMHGGYNSVQVRVKLGVNGVLAVFENSGEGFDYERLKKEAPPKRRLVSGPHGMRSRNCGLNMMNEESVEVWFQKSNAGFKTLLLFRANIVD